MTGYGSYLRKRTAEYNERETNVLHDLNRTLHDGPLQKGGVPAAPSGTATLLRLSPNHRFHPRPTLAVTDFRRPRLSWLDTRPGNVFTAPWLMRDY